MGKMLRIFGIIGIVLGIIIMIPVVTIPSGLAVTINGIVLYAIGKIYDDVRTIKDKLNIPVKFVGLGETPEDIAEFDPQEFVEALFG